MKTFALSIFTAILFMTPVHASPTGLTLASKGEYRPETQPNISYLGNGRMIWLSYRKPILPSAKSPFSTPKLLGGWSQMQNASTYGTGKPMPYVQFGPNVGF